MTMIVVTTRRARRRLPWPLVVGTAAAVLIVGAALVGPELLSLLGGVAGAQDLALGATAPGLSHPFGTDALGRDLLWRTLAAARVSLLLAALAAVIATLAGACYGGLAGLLGGRLDELLMRLVDVLLGLPYVAVALLVVAVLGSGAVPVIIALSLVGWLATARVVRGAVASLKRRDFVRAAVILGLPTSRVLSAHILPSLRGVLATSLALSLPSMIVQEGFLSFLGLGASDLAPSLGALLADGAAQLAVAWWTLLAPGTLVAVLVVALHVVADALRERLDDTLRDPRIG